MSLYVTVVAEYKLKDPRRVRSNYRSEVEGPEANHASFDPKLDRRALDR